MKLSTARLLNLVEALAFSAFVAWYIWQLQSVYFYAWLVFPVWMLASIVAHGDTPKSLGWRADNLWFATKRSAVVFALCISGLFLAGVLLGALHRPVHHLIVPRHFFGYMAFCLVQQVALNSYLTNRLLDSLNEPMIVSLVSGSIFAALHWPNPVLIPLTFIGGTVMAWLFTRERNIIPLVIGQGILGTLVWWAFPVAWHHAMRVGPGFYTFHPR
jgi:hypothetical protein